MSVSSCRKPNRGNRKVEEVTFDLGGSSRRAELGLILEFREKVFPKALTVSMITPGSLAHDAIAQKKTGICIGSRILQINGETIQHLPYDDQVYIVQRAVGSRKLAVTFETPPLPVSYLWGKEDLPIRGETRQKKLHRKLSTRSIPRRKQRPYTADRALKYITREGVQQPRGGTFNKKVRPFDEPVEMQHTGAQSRDTGTIY